MSAFNLAILLIRLAALNSVLEAIIRLGPGIVALFVAQHDAAVGIVIALCLLGLSVALWVLAPRVARHISRECDGHITFTSLSLQDCYTLLFVGVGLVTLVSNLSSALSWLYFLFLSLGGGREHQINLYEAFAAIFPILLSATLLVRAQKWGKKFSAMHIKNETVA